MDWKQHIWHDPNCQAWNRDPKTNKDYPHLVKRRGETVCQCGYDKDYEELKKFVEKMEAK